MQLNKKVKFLKYLNVTDVKAGEISVMQEKSTR